MHGIILAAEHDVKVAQTFLDITIREIQETCAHLRLGECPYAAHQYGHACPPLRVCMDCGLCEEGWVCGYKILIGDVTKLTRSRLLSLKRGNIRLQ